MEDWWSINAHKKRTLTGSKAPRGGGLITYPGNVTTRTDDLTTSKILWNSVLSTARANYMYIDIKNFYLCASMDRYEYTRMKLMVFPAHVQQQYNFQVHAKNGCIYLEIWRSIYGLLQAGKLSKKSYKTNSSHMDIMN